MSFDISSLGLEDVFRVAVRLEDEGIEFYKAASEKVDSKRLRDVLDRLVVEEVEHRMIFQQMATEHGIYLTPDPRSKEVSPQIMQALTEAGVFPPPEERDSAIGSLHSPAQVLRFAIRVEKGSVHFYKPAATAAESEKLRKTFDKILAQERRHVRLLSAELKAL